MSDYRYQIKKHNGIECLHVMIDGPEYEADGGLKRDSEGNAIIETHIPIDDILASMERPVLKTKVLVNLTGETIEQFRAVVREELQVVFTEVQITLQRLEKNIQHDVSTDDSSPVHVVRKELTPEQRKLIVEDVKQSLARDVRLSSGRIGF